MADGGPQDAIGRALPKPKRAFGRSLADFRIEGATTPNGLHPAEERLLDCAARGTACSIASVRPEEATPENTVRGAFLRFLLLGGDEDAPVHEKGVIRRAPSSWTTWTWQAPQAARPLKLAWCRVEGKLIGRNAQLGPLILSGSHIRGIDCYGAGVVGDVHLERACCGRRGEFFACRDQLLAYMRGGRVQEP